MSKPAFDRRQFVRLAALGGLSSSLPRFAAARAQNGAGDYKALVCVFLNGGNDSHNMLVPFSAKTYAQYAVGRGNLAIPQAELLPIEPLTSAGTEYALNPALLGLQSLFAGGKLAFLRNVGPLVEPVTKAQFEKQSAPLPPQLFSHKDQQFYWQTALGSSDTKHGWLGRIADYLAPANAIAALTSVSLDGANLMQVGKQTNYYALGTKGPAALNAFMDSLGPGRKLAFEALLSAAHPSPFAQTFANVQQEAIALEILLTDELKLQPKLATEFPESTLGQQLRMVAYMIAVRAGLGLTRQIFFCSKPAFDNHADLLTEYPLLLADLDASLKAFQDALEELHAAENVVLFSASDFGRSLSSNGLGSDHGWGGHALMLGTPVHGAELYGTMPELLLDGPDDVGAGRLLPTTSVDQYGATLARWMGIEGAALDAVFPNLKNFVEHDLGFLN